MLVLGATLAVFSTVTYHNFRKNLYADIDDLLSSRAYGIAEAVDTYWETEKMEDKNEAADPEAFRKIAQRWVEERSSDPKLINIMVQIFDSRGAEIARSRNMANSIELDPETKASALKGNDVFQNIQHAFSEGKILSVRVASIPVIENDKLVYIVQAASSLTTVHDAFNRLKTTLFVLLPLTVFLTGVVGAFLAKLTLNPVEHIMQTAQEITAENLKLRINVPDTRDEIQALAQTFNKMLERLQNTFSSQQQFIQDISHELKTPLTILKGQLEVTLKKMRSPQEYESVLVSNLEETDRLTRIIEDLLTLAHFDSKEIKLEIKSFSLNRMLERLLEDMRILARSKEIRINFFAPDPVDIEADERQVRRVFLNILDNAIKYTPSNGEIVLTLGQDDRFARVEIRDTGMGIPKEDLPFVFERFYRVDKARSTSGFGLGLSISKSIVEAHKGKIAVESQLNQGTTFIVSLPLKTLI